MDTRVPVELEDVLGSRALEIGNLTIGEVLAARRLPETLFQPYVVTGDEAVPVPLATHLADVPETADKLIVRVIRNTLFPTILPSSPDPPSPAVAPVPPGVGFRSVRTGADGLAVEVHAVLAKEEARQLIREQVVAFDERFALSPSGCVLGISGGGDSNALAIGLRAVLPSDRLLAFTLVFGAVFSEAAATRASLLCQDLEIEHLVLRPSEIGELLGLRTSLEALYDDFCAAFTDEALHFFGTFLILRTARALADDRGFGDLAFGYNREDLLAEVLFMIMNGHRPLSYPTRQVGRHRIVMPVWQAPKLLLDACHPNFSLENYRERDPYTTRQRSLAFFLAHSLDSAYPSFGLSILDGLSRVLDGHWGELAFDEDLDLFITHQAGPDLVEQVRQLLDAHFA